MGHHLEFTGRNDGNEILCPGCGNGQFFWLTNENLVFLANNKNHGLGEKLLSNDENVVDIAKCGCAHHTKNNDACLHDVELVRERYYA